MGGGKGKKKSQAKEKSKENVKPVKASANPYDGLEDEMEDLDIVEDSDSEPEVRPKGRMNHIDTTELSSINDTTDNGGDNGDSVEMPVEEKKISRKEMKKQKKKVCTGCMSQIDCLVLRLYLVCQLIKKN